jgi:hypothetical protein
MPGSGAKPYSLRPYSLLFIVLLQRPAGRPTADSPDALQLIGPAKTVQTKTPPPPPGLRHYRATQKNEPREIAEDII